MFSTRIRALVSQQWAELLTLSIVASGCGASVRNDARYRRRPTQVKRHGVAAASGSTISGTLEPEIAVVIVAEVRFYRDGLATIFDATRHIRVAGTAADAESGIALIRDLRPDVALIDVSADDSAATLRAILAAAPDAKVVALGVAEEEDRLVPLVEAGVAGYVTPEGSISDLTAAVESVANGESICSPRMVATLLRRIAALASNRRVDLDEPLTAREHQIVALIDQGLANKEIARRLCIELPTVKNHVHHILDKLHVTRRGEAAAKMRWHPGVDAQLSARPEGNSPPHSRIQ